MAMLTDLMLENISYQEESLIIITSSIENILWPIKQYKLIRKLTRRQGEN